MAPDLRARLLPFTLDNARAKRFYREHWSGVDVDSITGIDRLPALPTLSKDQYRDGFMFDFEDPGDSHYVSHSTGTTGPLTWRHRSLSEAATAQHLFGAANQRNKQEGPPRVAIVLSTAFHGMPFPLPSNGIAVPGAVHGDVEILQCIEMLNAKYRVGGHEVEPSAIMGQSEEIALLSQAINDRGVDSGKLGLKEIHSGGYIDSGMEALIKSAIDVSITGRYSLSEIFGGATYDPGLEAYRLDPYVLGEVVDESGKQLPPGEVGELTLTELFPLVQMQPLIRYRTGDIVQRVDAGDDLAFIWWGRRHETVATGSGNGRRWRFGNRHLAELLAREPNVERLEVRPGLTVVRTAKVGNLRFEVIQGNGDNGPGLKVWLRDVPESNSDVAEDLRARLLRDLAEICEDPALDLNIEFAQEG